MKDQLTNKEFDNFLENIEIESAPIGFTDKVMSKLETEVKLVPVSFTKFKIIYGSAISILLLLSFTSHKSTTTIFSVYYDNLLSSLDRIKPINIPTFDTPLLVAFTTLAIFFIILFDYNIQNRKWI